MEKVVLKVRNLFKSYNGTEILKNFELEVYEGEIFAVIGPNGAGKSTLIEILSGMKKEYNGEINLYGHNPGDTEIKPKIFTLPERPPILWYIKVKEMVWLFCLLYNLQKVELQSLREVGLQGKENRLVRNLSKGELQRLFVALALMVDAPFMLLDEPTSGLDPKMRRDVWELLAHKVKNGKTTIFYSTHYLQEAYEWADRIALLHKGRILKIARPKDLINEVVGVKERISLPEGSVLPKFDKIIRHKLSTRKRVLLYPTDSKEVLNKLMKHGGLQFKVEETSLEDVFLILTGEEYVEGQISD